MLLRVGHGYDVHRWGRGRALVLGGVEIPHDMGLVGHSDADVLLHAICDALLGALAMGDIGKHFPNTDPVYEGISSMVLLQKVGGLIKEAGWKVANLDATIIAERPPLSQHIPIMRARIAGALSLEPDAVSIKATTSEGLGFVGREEGIAAHAVALLWRD